MAHSAIKKLTAAVRVHAVPLVEAWAMSDTFLNSALGRQDGDVYTALYLMAQREPLNATDVSESYEHLRKLIGRPQNAAITRAKL
jgi:acyl-CoA oxidase